MRRHYIWLAIILLLALFAGWVSLPDNTGIHIDTNGDGTPEIDFNIRTSLGLDLVGGLRVLLRAELPPDAYTTEELRQTANNVGRRVNALGVTEPTIQVQGGDSILVELPGVSDSEQAIATIQQTALLEFVDFNGLSGQAEQFRGQRILTDQQLLIAQRSDEGVAPDAQVNPQTGQPFRTVISGGDLQSAVAQVDQAGQWTIRFELTPEGAALFGPFTAANIQQPLAIVLDGIVLSAPRINSRLDEGGTITGNFTEEEAKQLALQLRSGALPIPLRVDGAETVGASLGQDSVNLSIRAGIIGIVVVFMFMLIYYRVPGVAADLALIVFILLNFALFKLIPVTLTLPAITGFLISIGTAVDGNILIFERIKEELRGGSNLDDALRNGFQRAWQSIRDSNFSTILICGILFLFGQTPGASIVAGFAVTLAIGLIVNLFTAVIVTRTFLYIIVHFTRARVQQRVWLLGV